MITYDARPDRGIWPDAPEPAILCNYQFSPLSRALDDITILCLGLLPGESLRLITMNDDAVDVVKTWCLAHKLTMTRTTTVMELYHEFGCKKLIFFDIQVPASEE